MASDRRGRKNDFVEVELCQKPVLLAEEVGWNGDGVEAEQLPHLAVRVY